MRDFSMYSLYFRLISRPVGSGRQTVPRPPSESAVRRGPSLEDVVDDVHHVGDVNGRIVVDIAAFRIRRGLTALENIVYEEHRVADVDGIVVVAIATHTGNGDHPELTLIKKGGLIVPHRPGDRIDRGRVGIGGRIRRAVVAPVQARIPLRSLTPFFTDPVPEKGIDDHGVQNGRQGVQTAAAA